MQYWIQRYDGKVWTDISTTNTKDLLYPIWDAQLSRIPCGIERRVGFIAWERKTDTPFRVVSTLNRKLDLETPIHLRIQEQVVTRKANKEAVKSDKINWIDKEGFDEITLEEALHEITKCHVKTKAEKHSNNNEWISADNNNYRAVCFPRYIPAESRRAMQKVKGKIILLE